MGLQSSDSSSHALLEINPETPFFATFVVASPLFRPRIFRKEAFPDRSLVTCNRKIDTSPEFRRAYSPPCKGGVAAPSKNGPVPKRRGRGGRSRVTFRNAF